MLEELECGVVLTGSEVKSARAHRMSLDDAYAKVRDGEVWLYGCHIAEYPQATHMNHEPLRPRKLLMHRRQIRKFAEAAEHKGLTLVPLAAYFSPRGHVKIKLALARGRKLHDKREKLRREEARRDIERSLRR